MLEFVDRALHENHENWYPTKFKPSTVCTLLFSLLLAMFIDVGENHSVIDRVKLTFVHDEIGQLEVSKKLWIKVWLLLPVYVKLTIK